MEILRSILIILFVLAEVIEGQTPFGSFYKYQWGGTHTNIRNNETLVELLLDPYSGAGFMSKDSYLSGFFHIRMKLPEFSSPGVITSFLLIGDRNDGNAHTELDFEFLSQTGQNTLNTNIFANDWGNREETILLWFDPKTDFHNYEILWNEHHIVFYVDKIPIRIFNNHTKDGVNFPTGLMHVEASIYNASWAGKVDWNKAPFKAYYQDFFMIACPESAGPIVCASPSLFWNNILKLNPEERAAYEKVRNESLVYDYCKDRPQKECRLS